METLFRLFWGAFRRIFRVCVAFLHSTVIMSAMHGPAGQPDVIIAFTRDTVSTAEGQDRAACVFRDKTIS